MQAFCRLIGAGLLLLCATVADAQVHLFGRVIENTTEQPVIGATVVLQDGRGRRLAQRITDEEGQFSFVVGEKGPVGLQAQRIGYQRTTTPLIHFDSYTSYMVEVRVDVAAVPLAPLEVVARSRAAVSPTLAGFEERRRSGMGWFMTREDIEKRNAGRVSDLVAMAPGVLIQRRIVVMARASNCPAQIFVDGFHINRSTAPLPGARRGRSTTELFPIDEVVQPGSVQGIEVYQGLSRLPAEFRTPDAACGVVAIWTRRGG